MNQARLTGRAVVYFTAQFEDVDLQSVGERVGVGIPHSLQNPHLAHHFALVAKKKIKQIEFLAAQIDFPGAAPHREFFRINFQIVQTEAAGSTGRFFLPARETANLGQQFPEVARISDYFVQSAIKQPGSFLQVNIRQQGD